MNAIRSIALCISTSVALGCHSPREPEAGVAAAAAQERQPPASAELVGRTLTDAKPLRLRELVDRADRIFLGRVVRVEAKKVTLAQDGDSTEAEVRDVTIAITDGIKNAKAGEQVVVRQLVAVSSPLRENDEVVWYLARPSELGLTQPLGVFSGDFRVTRTDAGATVNNLRGNADLWEGSLWQGEGFNRQRVLATARTLPLPPARVSQIDRAAREAPDERKVPLDLLLAATKSQLP